MDSFDETVASLTVVLLNVLQPACGCLDESILLRVCATVSILMHVVAALAVAFVAEVAVVADGGLSRGYPVLAANIFTFAVACKLI